MADEERLAVDGVHGDPPVPPASDPALRPAPGPVTDELATAAHTLWMESAAAGAWSRLAEAGVPAVLLKGPAIAHWLYDAGEVRPVRDIDLLVAPADTDRAMDALGELGYEVPLLDAPECEVGPNTQSLVGPDGVRIDLHHRLIGVPDPPSRCWDVLSRRTVPFPLVTGAEVRVLDVPARALHLSLHAAQNGPVDTKALADLRRGLARLTFDDWRAAADLAAVLRATPSFAAGLRLCPEGLLLAETLELPEARDVELELRITSAPQDSLFFARLAATRGASAKVRLVARKLWPTTTFLRANSELARRGPAGLARARVVRVRSVLQRARPAFAAWWDARARVRAAGARQARVRAAGAKQARVRAAGAKRNRARRPPPAG